MKAKLIQTEGEWGEAVIDTEQGRFFVIDKFSYGKRDVGKEFDIKLSVRSSSSWKKWKEVAGSNPEKRNELVHVNYSYYKCYGKVISFEPLIVECGSFQIESPFSLYNPSCVGKFVAIDARLHAISLSDIHSVITESGYLGFIKDWTPEFAEISANIDGLTLTEEHWVLINYVHEYALEHEIAPSLKSLRKVIREKQELSDRMKRLIKPGKKAGYTVIYELFPNDGVLQLCRYAGCPQIHGC